MRIVFSSPKIINALVFVWKICSKNHRVFTPNFGRGSPIETMVGVRDEIMGGHTMEVFFWTVKGQINQSYEDAPIHK